MALNYVLRFEMGTSERGVPNETQDGGPLLSGRLGTAIEVVVEPARVLARYSSIPEAARDRGFELLRVLRGVLGFHFSQPLEVMNVSINSEDGSVVDTLSGRPYKVGWADWGGIERRGFADRYEESVRPAR